MVILFGIIHVMATPHPPSDWNGSVGADLASQYAIAIARLREVVAGLSLNFVNDFIDPIQLNQCHLLAKLIEIVSNNHLPP